MYGPCDDAGRPGEGSLNVRSVIDPLLVLRKSPGRSGALPFDVVDPRLCMRFVCICPTGAGLVVRERRAAAAAAAERSPLEARFARKACVAASDAA